MIPTQRLLEEDIIKDNVSQELPGNSDGCFHLKPVLQIAPTAFMLGKNCRFRSHVQVMYKTLEKPSQKKEKWKKDIAKTSRYVSYIFASFPCKGILFDLTWREVILFQVQRTIWDRRV